MPTGHNSKPDTIVLSKVLTGLSTVRGVATGGVKVHAAVFDSGAPVRFSIRCKTIQLASMVDDPDRLIRWLLTYVKKLENRPVVIPTCDEYALLLAKNYPLLIPHCRLWTTTFEDLQKIVNKDALYGIADSVGVEVIPALFEPDLAEVDAWTQLNPGPYFLKPFYEGIAGCALREKNLQCANRDQLLSYVAKNGAKFLIIQRLIRGGDGHIFDTYGLCDAQGEVRTIASHRRWRQLKPDVGTTTYGEIPMSLSEEAESTIFEQTERFLAAMRFHGIFGIEWLQDKATGKFYLIDFNARPFSSIGHLTACGLNLPLLAYRELVGDDLPGLAKRPALKHKYWVDLLRDTQSVRLSGALRMADWIMSILRCRSFAYWDWRDPGPGVYRMLQIVALGARLAWKKFT